MDRSTQILFFVTVVICGVVKTATAEIRLAMKVDEDSIKNRGSLTGKTQVYDSVNPNVPEGWSYKWNVNGKEVASGREVDNVRGFSPDASGSVRVQVVATNGDKELTEEKNVEIYSGGPGSGPQQPANTPPPAVAAPLPTKLEIQLDVNGGELANAIVEAEAYVVNTEARKVFEGFDIAWFIDGHQIGTGSRIRKEGVRGTDNSGVTLRVVARKGDREVTATRHLDVPGPKPQTKPAQPPSSSGDKSEHGNFKLEWHMDKSQIQRRGRMEALAIVLDRASKSPAEGWTFTWYVNGAVAGNGTNVDLGVGTDSHSKFEVVLQAVKDGVVLERREKFKLH